ncbi:MAG: hypothetical protein WCT28_03645 [Patescibacteria group bacterium]|jgi:hypothetical protein
MAVSFKEISGNLTSDILRAAMVSGERLKIPLRRSGTNVVGDGHVDVIREDSEHSRFILTMTYWPLLLSGDIETYISAWVDVDENGVGSNICTKLALSPTPMIWVYEDKIQ